MKRAVLLSILTLSSSAMADDWARWRGPEGTGFAPGSNPPINWSETSNIRWKAAIPGFGHSSPIVLDDRVYLMSAIKTDTVDPNAPAAEPPRRGRGRGRGPSLPTRMYEFVVIALDRETGDEVWKRTVAEERPHEGMHSTASYSSISPVTDGTHIIAHFGSRGLFCLDMSGEVVWDVDLGDMRTRNQFGEGASPCLHEDMLFVPWDHEDDSFIVALNKKTGSEKWRVARNELTSWTTPVVAEVNGARQVIMAGANSTIAYDYATGDEIWRCRGLTNNVVPTPIVAHGNVYVTSGFRGSSLQAIRLAAATGDISDSDAVVWEHNRGTPYVPSPMLSDTRLYFLGSNAGIVSCFDAVTGEEYYAGKRLEDVRNVYSSIVGAGGHVYICGREGGVAVLEDGPEFKVVAVNKLDEGINATPAIVGDTIYVRGANHLYCIEDLGS